MQVIQFVALFVALAAIVLSAPLPTATSESASPASVSGTKPNNQQLQRQQWPSFGNLIKYLVALPKGRDRFGKPNYTTLSPEIISQYDKLYSIFHREHDRTGAPRPSATAPAATPTGGAIASNTYITPTPALTTQTPVFSTQSPALVSTTEPAAALTVVSAPPIPETYDADNISNTGAKYTTYAPSELLTMVFD
ncbi:hypothetical protein GGI07_004182 [Coemansia sp. Benny D115]|nr:hypothetical protein GGI07_004182 [Coemansia sp. Benny D115]